AACARRPEWWPGPERPGYSSAVVFARDARRGVVLRGERRGSIRRALPSITSPSACCFLRWRWTAYQSAPAPTAAATATAGLRRTKLPTTRLPVLATPSAAPVLSHLPVVPGSEVRMLSPTCPTRSITLPEYESSLLMRGS